MGLVSGLFKREAVHFGVNCDEREMSPIRGIRFKSVSRDDFSLCKTCVKNEAHIKDTYRKIEQEEVN